MVVRRLPGGDQVKDGAILLIGIVLVVMLFSPALRRTGLRAFVASVIYQAVRTIWRGGR